MLSNIVNKTNFVNPYSFIPLGTKVDEKLSKIQDNSKVSGVIEYKLLTKTPLFIPDTENNHYLCPDYYNKATGEEKKNGNFHKSYKFFEINKKPVIPGSEIRGMLRSNFEILTDSCLSKIQLGGILSRRNSEVFKAGLIKKTRAGYELYEAEDCLIRYKKDGSLFTKPWPDADKETKKVKSYLSCDLSEGKKIYVNARENGRGKRIVTELSKEKACGCYEAYVIKGEAGPELDYDKSKHNCHVFLVKGVKKLSVELDIKKLDNVLKIYEENGEHNYTEYKKNWDQFKEKANVSDYFPVYYSIIRSENNDDNGNSKKENSEIVNYFLSPASITREVYNKKLDDMIKNHRPCSKVSELCPACRLFGAVSLKDNNGKGTARSSKVRCTDLVAEKISGDGTYYFDNAVTLKELSSPKNAAEFYLKRPKDAWFWTYDYYIKDGKTIPYDAEINGRKFYWHNLNVKEDDYKSEVQADVKNLSDDDKCCSSNCMRSA